MACYAVTYDLRKQRNYQPLWNLLKSWGAVRLLESFWLLHSGASVAQIRDALAAVVDGDDGIAVIEVKAPSLWATWNAIPLGVAWLKRFIP
jgi:hypothetical protein